MKEKLLNSGQEFAHNGNAEWIKTVEIELSDVEKQEPISITKENVVQQEKLYLIGKPQELTGSKVIG